MTVVANLIILTATTYSVTTSMAYRVSGYREMEQITNIIINIDVVERMLRRRPSLHHVRCSYFILYINPKKNIKLWQRQPQYWSNNRNIFHFKGSLRSSLNQSKQLKTWLQRINFFLRKFRTSSLLVIYFWSDNALRSLWNML